MNILPHKTYACRVPNYRHLENIVIYKIQWVQTTQQPQCKYIMLVTITHINHRSNSIRTFSKHTSDLITLREQTYSDFLDLSSGHNRPNSNLPTEITLCKVVKIPLSNLQ
jgi:hypothetical protein